LVWVQRAQDLKSRWKECRDKASRGPPRFCGIAHRRPVVRPVFYVNQERGDVKGAT